jgi:hypothetical protein
LGVSRRSVIEVPVSCRRYTLNSERRSVNSDTAMVLLVERNAGRRMEAPSVKFTLAEPTESSLELPQMLRSSPRSNGRPTPTLEIWLVRSRMRPPPPRKLRVVHPSDPRKQSSVPYPIPPRTRRRRDSLTCTTSGTESALGWNWAVSMLTVAYRNRSDEYRFRWLWYSSSCE